MQRVILTEGITDFSQMLINTLSEQPIEVIVLHDRTSKQMYHTNVTYQSIDYLNIESWQQIIRKDDIIIVNMIPEMLNSKLWHGTKEALHKMLIAIIKTIHPKLCIDVTFKVTSEIMHLPDGYHASSIQSTQLKKSYSLKQLLLMYAEYLNQKSRGLIKVQGLPNRYDISFKYLKWPLIAMRPIKDDRLERIHLELLPNGLLYRDHQKAKASFIFSKDNEFELQILLHHFTPRLPWIIYQYTQAVIHEWVMKDFIRWLNCK